VLIEKRMNQSFFLAIQMLYVFYNVFVMRLIVLLFLIINF